MACHSTVAGSDAAVRRIRSMTTSEASTFASRAYPPFSQSSREKGASPQPGIRSRAAASGKSGSKIPRASSNVTNQSKPSPAAPRASYVSSQ